MSGFEWMENTPKEVEVGDRIKLVNMPDDPRPLESGTEGTVTSVDKRMDVIGVEWDNGSRLNLVIGVDSFSILNEGASDAAIINKSMPKPTLQGKNISAPRVSMNKNFKTALQKGRVKDIKVEGEELEGGKADGMTIQDLADKHGTETKKIQKELKVGVKIEMEHTDSPKKAKEVAMDHISEFPDFYTNPKHGAVASEKGLEKVHENSILENFFGSMGNAFGKKQNKDDQYDTKMLAKDLTKITDSIKTGSFRHQETIRKMIETFRGKYSEHSMIDTMMKSLYHEFDGMGEQEIDETTGAMSSGSGDLNGTPNFGMKRESRIIKVSDLLESTTTTNSGDYQNDSETPFDSNKDGWFWNDKPWWEGGEIVDDVAQLDHNWKDKLLSVKMTKEELINKVSLLESGSEGEYSKVIKTINSCTTLIQLKSAKKYAQNFINKQSIDKEEKKFKKIQTTINLMKNSLKGDTELDEMTASSSGSFEGPMFAAKDDESWKMGKKPIWKGGTIVQKVKNSGVLSEVNKVKSHEDGVYVKLKDTCVKYNNQPWCDAGNASDPLILSKTTSENISKVAKKMGISEEEVKKVVINRLTI